VLRTKDLGFKLARKAKTPTKEGLAFKTDARYYLPNIVHQIQPLVKENRSGIGSVSHIGTYAFKLNES
jgi:hypothetical protein